MSDDRFVTADDGHSVLVLDDEQRERVRAVGRVIARSAGLRPWPDYGYKFTVEEFAARVADGSFTDDDGSAHMATEDGLSRDYISCEDVRRGLYEPSFTHVAWFNK